MIFLIKGFEVTAVKSIADLAQEVVVKPKIVLDSKPHPDEFFRADQVTDISAGMLPAGGAAAVRIDRPGVVDVLFVHQVDLSVPGEQIAVTRIS